MTGRDVSGQTWWRIGARYGTEVTPVEVERETPRFLITKRLSGATRREAKSSEWSQHYPTRDEALNAILHRLRRDVERHEAGLADARKALQKFRESLSSPQQERET